MKSGNRNPTCSGSAHTWLCTQGQFHCAVHVKCRTTVLNAEVGGRQRRRAPFPQPHHHMAEDRGRTSSPTLMHTGLAHPCPLPTASVLSCCPVEGQGLPSTAASERQIQVCAVLSSGPWVEAEDTNNTNYGCDWASEPFQHPRPGHHQDAR